MRYDAGLEERVTTLLASNPGGHVYVPPGPIRMLQQLADNTGVSIRVSRDVPRDTLYLLRPEDADRMGADYVVEPS